MVAAAASVGGVLERRRRRRVRKEGGRVHILEYHDVSSGGAEPEGTISAQRFGSHLDAVGRRRKIVPLTEAVGRLASGERLDEDLVAVTFDDGYLENYTSAWPELRSRQLSGAIFLTTGFLDGQDLWFDGRAPSPPAGTFEPRSSHPARHLSTCENFRQVARLP